MVREEERTDLRAFSTIQPQEMMHREHIVWMVARSRHEQHALRVCIVLQVAAKFLFGDRSCDLHCYSSQTSAAVSESRSHSAAFDLLLHVHVIDSFSDPMSSLDVCDLMSQG